GLSCAVGFKNGTDGSLTVATNALESAARPHRFLGINHDGRVSVYTTRGNRYGHIVLRGGSQGPNYDSVHVKLAETALAEAGLSTNIMVDCSHANSNKDPALQPLVVENVVNQILEGNESIVGLMVESHLNAGKQPLARPEELAYGVSITDGCIGWEETARCLRSAREALQEALPARRRKHRAATAAQ
ncbi:MAG TPA: 3-deoxy-7-phosphoheptulonate synthase, partial [Pseudohaliea sp.]|nr:3-deoxy-7-phosphoheptulonate synthase [Pseudohaliea sp.]